jgi:exonuclease V gamma subunit
MIREHQEDRYKKLFENSVNKTETPNQKPQFLVEEVENGFNDAQLFLQNLHNFFNLNLYLFSSHTKQLSFSKFIIFEILLIVILILLI